MGSVIHSLTKLNGVAHLMAAYHCTVCSNHIDTCGDDQRLQTFGRTAESFLSPEDR